MKMKTDEILNSILEISNLLKINLYGIRNKETDKFTVIGILDNKVLYADASNWIQVKLWNKIEDAKTVYDILCKCGNEDFKVNKIV